MGQDMKINATYSEVKIENLEWPKHRSERYWEYRKKWEDYPKSGYVSDFPLCLDIETTNICNLRCGMCPRTIQIDNGTYVDIGTMDMGLYKKIIDEGGENGLYSIKLQYLGEPLLDKYICERIKYAKDHGVEDVAFNTNATELTEEMSHNLLEAGIDGIYFSVDSMDADTFNKIRPGSDFHIVINNIKNFMKIKNESGNYKHVQTRVSMTVMPANQHEVEPFKKYWLPIVGQVGFGEWVEHSSTAGEIIDYNPDFVCSQPFQRMFIMYDGVCTPCCVDDARGYVVGEMGNSSVKEVWHGEAYQKLRESHLSHNYRDIEICKRCFMPFSKTG